jgi:hemerythrin-like metal-binding protein
MHFTTLLIEPPGVDSQLINLMLAPEKFHVKTAECGPDAWNLILESDPPDLVIIDTDLPLNGDLRIGASQLIELMQERPGWSHTPRLILTSDGSSTIFQQVDKAHVCAAILKPYDPRRFIQEIYHCLRNKLDAHIKELNRQHIELRNLIKNVAKSQNQKTIKEGLRDFLIYLERHFDFEEQYMQHHYYPYVVEHQEGHGTLYAKAKKLINGICRSDQVITGDIMDNVILSVFDGVEDDKKYIDFLYELIDSLTNQITTGEAVRYSQC